MTDRDFDLSRCARHPEGGWRAKNKAVVGNPEVRVLNGPDCQGLVCIEFDSPRGWKHSNVLAASLLTPIRPTVKIPIRLVKVNLTGVATRKVPAAVWEDNYDSEKWEVCDDFIVERPDPTGELRALLEEEGIDPETGEARHD